MTKMKYSQYNVSLGHFDPKQDLVILKNWIRQPHVIQGWGDSKEIWEQIKQHSPSDSAMIYVDTTPVGYLCWQIPTRQELTEACLDSLPSDLVDIDIMIGDPNYLGQGIGPQALTLLISQLSSEGVKIVGLATTVSNDRALKAYEKVGFIRYKLFNEQGVDHYYLTKATSSAA